MYKRRYQVAVKGKKYETDAFTPYDVFFNEREHHAAGTRINITDLYSKKTYEYKVGRD